jgi:SAM-dependent methyltransferase
MSILDRIRKSDLREYLEACSKVSSINVDKAYETTLRCIQAHDEGNSDTANLREITELKTKWYASLAYGAPDYSVYENPYYFCEVWICWIKYSRGYLKAIERDKQQYGNPARILDLGCGFGYTTAALKEIFPAAEVIGTNVVNSSQWALAESLGRQYGFTLIDEAGTIQNSFDLIFASEYFEHFEEPIRHLRAVLKYFDPTYLVVANTFSGEAIGHFTEYRDLDDQYKTGGEMSRLFNATLSEYGYKQKETTYWNNRPTVWHREPQVSLEF